MKKKVIIAILASSLLVFTAKAKAAAFQDNPVVDSGKKWTIHFNQEVLFDDLSKQNIVVTDSNGTKVNSTLQLGDDGKSIIVAPPDKGYDEGKSYKLSIGNKVHSKNNKDLKQQITMNFSIKKDSDNEIVTFKDKNLENVVRNNINKPNGVIYEKDVKKITSLYGVGRGIEHLDGIEKLTNLESVYLYGNNISDITSLGSLTKLTCIDIQSNQIKDITPLKNLTNLQELILGSNKIENIDSLKNLVSLQNLNLASNNISDIGSLSELTNLRKLELENYPTDLSKNHIKNIDSLCKLVDLQELFLYSNEVSNIEPLKDLKNLQKLNLEYNDISDISSLSKLINLQEIYLNDNKISDIDALQNMCNLKELILEDNQITSIEPLENLINLKKLSIDNNPVRDGNILIKLSNLESLDVGCNLSCIEPIRQMKKLKEISAYEIGDLNQIYAIYDKAKEIIKSIIKPGMSDLQKEKAIHDYIALNTKYDYYNYSKNTLKQWDYNPYGILIKGTGVGRGYADATKLLLDMEGINCIIVSGYDNHGEGHAWNMVEIGGKYYQLDTTWEFGDKQENIVKYDYFNLDDKEMSEDYYWDRSKYPKCEDSLNEDGISRHTIIKFKDSNFEKVVRDIINKQVGDISIGDVRKVAGIRYKPQNESTIIKDISGIENFKDLNGLYLNGNSIESVEPLKNLKNLESLSLDNNKISNVDVLSSFTHLRYFSISNNNIRNIDSLKNLNKLLELNIKGNPISQNDVDGLKKILSNCKITF